MVVKWQVTSLKGWKTTLCYCFTRKSKPADCLLLLCVTGHLLQVKRFPVYLCCMTFASLTRGGQFAMNDILLHLVFESFQYGLSAPEGCKSSRLLCRKQYVWKDPWFLKWHLLSHQVLLQRTTEFCSFSLCVQTFPRLSHKNLRIWPLAEVFQCFIRTHIKRKSCFQHGKM